MPPIGTKGPGLPESQWEGSQQLQTTQCSASPNASIGEHLLSDSPNHQTKNGSQELQMQVPTIIANVRGAADGEVILNSHEVSRTHMVEDLKHALVLANGVFQNEHGRNGSEGGFQITILHECEVMKNGECP